LDVLCCPPAGCGPYSSLPKAELAIPVRPVAIEVAAPIPTPPIVLAKPLVRFAILPATPDKADVKPEKPDPSIDNIDVLVFFSI
jgi:hypothetical protein